MNLSFEKHMTISLAQTITMKYGAILELDDFAELSGFNKITIANKINRGDKDLPKYTQLKGKRVFLANDIAEWMVDCDLKFPKN
ncbi:hypothetical protein BKH41_09350 [Helicobacter sp. 12S02232-10]|uniref:hypothetical protein n=1 Tax=Helicobacter sp. 12S02232-10 TaxID=1476197 RepID=UPI000BA739F8|nr:hypothetical protein [Helicobacter sp. 12S02232-10]PAF46303.1 hypothetical protein BKH41_09350 [Helicobacter sp. 12S02232-10]